MIDSHNHLQRPSRAGHKSMYTYSRQSPPSGRRRRTRRQLSPGPRRPMTQRHPDPHIEAATDVSQTEGLPARRRDLHAEAAIDALARLEKDVGVADVLLVGPPLGLEAARVRAIGPSTSAAGKSSGPGSRNAGSAQPVRQPPQRPEHPERRGGRSLHNGGPAPICSKLHQLIVGHLADPRRIWRTQAGHRPTGKTLIDGHRGLLGVGYAADAGRALAAQGIFDGKHARQVRLVGPSLHGNSAAGNADALGRAPARPLSNRRQSPQRHIGCEGRQAKRRDRCACSVAFPVPGVRIWAISRSKTSRGNFSAGISRPNMPPSASESSKIVQA